MKSSRIYPVHMARTVICFLVMLLSACASPIPAPFEINNGGHLLVGIGTNKISGLQSFELVIRRLGSIPFTGTNGIIRLCRSASSRDCDSPDYQNDAGLGIAVARRMPPGKYVLTSIRSKFLVLDGSASFYSLGTRQSPDIRFEIKEGETSYLGRYWIDKFLPVENPHDFSGSQAIVNVTDKLSIDQEIAVRKMPALFGLINDYTPSNIATQETEFLLETSNKHTGQIVTAVRSEKITDGKEFGCTWWCQ